MPKYTKENKAELIYKPFQKLKTKKAKVKFLEALLQERIDHPEHFRGLNQNRLSQNRGCHDTRSSCEAFAGLEHIWGYRKE